LDKICKAAEEKIGPLAKGEKINGTYECRVDYMRGFLVCTNKGIQFIQGGGKNDEVFKKLFEAPYKDLDVGEEANTKLILTIDGMPYKKRLEPIGKPISVLEELLEPYVGIHEMPTPFLVDMRNT